LYQVVSFLQIGLITALWRCPACHRNQSNLIDLGQGP
jgi:hypothetical protein